MKTFLLLLFATATLIACSQKQKATTAAGINKVQVKNNNQIAQGTYVCWLNSPSSASGMRALGELSVSGNSYSGDIYGKGTYSYDPSTRIVHFNGGGLDHRKDGHEWIGIFYNKGDKFIDGSTGKAANTMLIITKLEDWNAGRKKAWIQQCDLK